MIMKEDISNQVKFLLLSVIDNNADIDDIHRLGYSYSQITLLIKKEIDTGNARFENKVLTLTDKGQKLKVELAKELKFDSSEIFILPKFSAKLENKVDVASVFIPSENELDF